MPNISDIRELKEWLIVNGIDISGWGKGGKKSIENLWDEFANGDIQLLNNPPSRVVNVVEVSILRGDSVLIEAVQEFGTGEQRFRNRLPSEKIRIGESYFDAALRCLEEELGIDKQNVTSMTIADKPQESITDSPSYPGLATKYTFHSITVEVNGLPQGDFWRENAAFEHGDPVKRHYWRWRAK